MFRNTFSHLITPDLANLSWEDRDCSKRKPIRYRFSALEHGFKAVQLQNYIQLFPRISLHQSGGKAIHNY